MKVSEFLVKMAEVSLDGNAKVILIYPRTDDVHDADELKDVDVDDEGNLILRCYA